MSAPPAPPAEHAPTPPGWYADPAHPGSRRYWDGQSWTEQIAPSPEGPRAAGSSALNVAGYSAAVFIPILGLILGIVAAKKHNGVGTNHGPWIIGVAVLSFVLSLLILAGGSA